MNFIFEILNYIRKAYWFIFRPKTFGVKILIESENKYLLVKNTYGGHYWTLPGGGIARKESKEEAIIRELAEETSLRVNLDDLRYLGAYKSNLEFKKDTVFCFYSNIEKEKNIIVDQKEIQVAKWFDKNNLPKDISRATKESIQMLKTSDTRDTRN